MTHLAYLKGRKVEMPDALTYFLGSIGLAGASFGMGRNLKRTDFLALALAPTLGFVAVPPAAAQVNTNCNVYGNSVNCQTTDPDQGMRDLTNVLNEIARERRERRQQEAMNAEMARLAAERQRLQAEAESQARYAQQQQLNAQYQAQQEQIFLGLVSQAIIQGECEDAKAIALSQNRLDVADQAMRLCTPKPVAKPSPPNSRRGRRSRQ